MHSISLKYNWMLIKYPLGPRLTPSTLDSGETLRNANNNGS